MAAERGAAAIPLSSTATSALGHQHDSQRETRPCYSFGTGTREAGQSKVFISKDHQKRSAILKSPGPVYSKPTTVGMNPRYCFGTEERRSVKAKYPDSSVDLTGAVVDTQDIKFASTQGVLFGTEARMQATGEVVKNNPAIVLGMESPSAFEHSPEDTQVLKKAPEYSFGPAGGVDGKKNVVPPINGIGCTPRQVGPGSYSMPPGLCAQVHSIRSTAPSHGFGTSPRMRERRAQSQMLELSPELSSLGKQVVSKATSSPRCQFGKSTRDGAAKTTMCFTQIDRGPAGYMPKLRLGLAVPPSTSRATAR